MKKSHNKHVVLAGATPSRQKQPCDYAFPIVGIGSSAGGLEALQMFFDQLPSVTGMAFVLISHLNPNHKSILTELIQRHTRMLTVEVQDGTCIEPNTVYIIPPNSHVVLEKGVLRLVAIERREVARAKLPVDVFLCSLAETQKRRAIAIILSGNGSDGSVGVRAVKAEFGMIMAQEPSTAKFDGMPQNAIQTGLVDFVCAPDKLPKQLIQYVKHFTGKIAPKSSVIGDMIMEHLPDIYRIIQQHTGHDFSQYKSSTICRRIERRMNVHQFEFPEEYVRFMEATPTEVDNLFRELLIGVTNFFRDAEAFDLLKKHLLAYLADKPNDYLVRVWVPGCSGGEEVYSLSILIRECMDELKKSFRSQVFGTDIDSDAIEEARAGIYSSSIETEVGPERLKRFFVRNDSTYRIKKEIREMTILAPQNVIRDPPFTKMDLISCRNVLIYMDPQLQKRLIPVFHYSLKPGGILFLGSSESVSSFTQGFGTLDSKWKIYKAKAIGAFSDTSIEIPTGRGDFKGSKTRLSLPDLKSTHVNLTENAQKALANAFAPPSVIINGKGEVVFVHGQTGKYLQPATGQMNANIVSMAREGLRLELASVIRRAIAHKKSVVVERLKVRTNGSYQLINLAIKPVRDPSTMSDLFIVTFQDVAPVKNRPGKSAPAAANTTRDRPDKKVRELENELKKTQEFLQVTIEQVESSNEELKSSNEELQSTNEELQSSNEELETSKEELQSLNEELVTVNTELQGKIEELSQSNNDFKNLLDSTRIATIFIDVNLNIKRFSSEAIKVLHLIPSDAGRPLEHMNSGLKHSNLLADVNSVIRTTMPRETEVQSNAGCWYLMRIMPYRNSENAVEGAVITFIDVNEIRKHREEERRLLVLHTSLHQQNLYWETIIESLQTAVMVLDVSFKVLLANRTFYEKFFVSPDEVLNHDLNEFGNHQWDIPTVRIALEEMKNKKAAVTELSLDHVFQRIGRRNLNLNIQRVTLPDTTSDLFVFTIHLQSED